MEESMIATQSNPEAIAQTWKDFIADRSNKTLRNELIEHYLPLVRYHAERVWSRLPDEVDLEDLASAGVFGLMDAIDAYDLERGVKFEPECVPRIRGAMLDELRNMDWVPRLVRSRARKLAEASKELADKLGRHPTQEELAERLNIDQAELSRVMSDANAANLVSLNKKWFETDGSKDVSEIDLVEDERSEDPTTRLQKSDLIRLVTRGLNRNER
ncbi:MAG: sigma-70 family RNA polymerase sigma factor, partial [Thermoguttaceae bacterium]|nr:sigma-70 family RNA polymerase sigma factor [Thermoguttaceae bacterium]